jgi:hypothetical protein
MRRLDTALPGAALAAGFALCLAPTAAVGGWPVALVTAETANEVLAVSLPDGKVVRRVHVRDPQAIAARQSGRRWSSARRAR